MADGPQHKQSGTRARIGKVLVVDESAELGDQLSADLRDHYIVAAECGEDALALVAAGQRFDLILCEVMMQGMNGVEFLASLQETCPAQAERVVFMADRMVSPIVQHLLDGVPHLCIERPFDLEGLRSLLERRIREPVAETA